MRILYCLIALCLSLIPSSMYAQCPPAGFPDPGNTCTQAPILCPTIDGYCSTINNNNSPQNFPSCPGWTLNNDEWFAFFAGSTTITIQVTPSNCSAGSQMGLQGAIYRACGPPWVAMDAQCSCTTSPFVLTASNFVVGQIYWFVLDGCGGNVCNYSISVLAGSTVGVPPANPGAVTGPSPACAGVASTYTLPVVTGATIYNWTVTPATAGTINSNNNNATVTWASNYSGPATLCVTTSNLCFPNPTPSCITVDVLPKPTATISGSGIICQGTPSNVNLSVAFTGTPPWQFTYAINNVAQPPPIVTSTNPYILPATLPGTYTILNVFSTNSTPLCPGTVSGSSPVTLVTITPTATPVAATCGQSNGSVNLSTTGGTTPYTYMWSNSATTQNLSGVPPGVYTVTVTSANGCTKTATATVNDNMVNLSVTAALLPNTTCNASPTGNIDVSVAPAGTYTYLWAGGETTQDLTGLPAGTYTVTVSQGLTCTKVASFTIVDTPNNPNPVATPVASTCDLPNGSVNVSVTGGVSPYTFLWPGGETTQNLTPILAGSYTLTVTGANGCTRTVTATVANNNPPINITSAILPNTTCNSTSTGAINVSVAPAGTYTYLWSGGETTQDLTGLPAGSYSLTVSAGGTCTAVASFTVPDAPNPPNVSATPVATTCDLSNGSINVNVSGGVTPYTYLWTGGQTTQNLGSVPAGDYSVTVTGANGCSRILDVTISNNNPPINVTSVIQANTSCNSTGTGGINVSVAPAGTYTYLWSGGETTQDLTGLQPGSYSLTVSTGGSCSAVASFTVPDNPNPPTVNPNSNPSTCDLNNGSISVGVSGGVPPYTFLWDGGQTTQNLTMVLAGSYSLTVTGANGCTAVGSVNVSNNNPTFNVTAVIQANTTCVGANNGSINVSVAPAAGPYTYMWSGAQTTQDLSGLSPGSYSLTVSAGGSCTVVTSFEVPGNPNQPSLNPNAIPSTCDLPNGSITLSATGGITPYTFLWSNNATTQSISGLLPDTYTVTVTSANGCSSVASVSVPNNNPNITLNANTFPNTTCNASPNGSIDLMVSPPGTYTYLWSNSATTQDISGLQPGSYSVIVSAGGSCTETASFEIVAIPNEPILTYTTIPAKCGLSNGSINLSVSNGVPPYTYLWIGGQMTQDLNNIPAGTYTVTVTGANACSATEVVTVENDDIPVSVSAVIKPKTSCLVNNGSISLSVTPANSTVLWSTNATTLNLNNLAPGDYTVTVSAGGTCTTVETFTVDDATELPMLSVDITAALCNFGNGSVDLSVDGGVPPYTYKWSNNSIFQDLNNVVGGNYAVTVTTAVGCSAVIFAPVPNDVLPIEITGSPSDDVSCTSNNGYIYTDVSPAAPYTYKWSTNATTPDLINLGAGTYTVTVTYGSCKANATFVILNAAIPPNPSISATAAICGQSNGAVTLTVSGATAPYTYKWSNMASTPNLVNVAPGTYTVTVTDFFDCTATASAVVLNNNIAVNVTGATTGNTSCAVANGTIDISVLPVGTYTYIWSNTATTQDLGGLAAGTYTVTVSAGVGCTASSTFIIGNNTQNPQIGSAITAAICSQNNGAIDVTVTGASTPYIFAWSNTAVTEDLTAILPGNYTLTVTAANGCTADTTLNVANNSSTFSLSGAATPYDNCATVNGAVNLIVTPAGPYTYLWSNAATTEDLSGVPAGTYTVQVTESGSCIASATFFVLDERTYPTTNQNVTAELCNLSDGAINLTISGGLAPFSYLWSSAQTSQNITGVPGGDYTVTITGANNCSTTATATVPENSLSFALAGISTANTSCVVNNGAIDLSLSPAIPAGGPGYSYLWTNMATTEDLNMLPAGSYTVTVSAGGTCTNTATYVVDNDAGAPSISESTTSALCGQSNGSVGISIGTGTPPYQFIWSNAATTEDIDNVPSGNYSVTVTSINGCTATGSYAVAESSVTPSILGSPQANTSCVAPNGTIDLNVTPATLTYTYIWSNSATTQNVANLSTGSYTVTVNGGGLCTSTATFAVVNNAGAPGIASSITAALCGQSSGSVNVTIGTGTPPYQFIWSNAATTEDLDNVPAGSYIVTVTSANGCTSTSSFAVADSTVLPSLVGIPQANTRCTAPNGSIGLTVSPATLTYTYIWSNSATTESIANLTAGSYTVTVNGGGLCTSTATFAVANAASVPTISGTIASGLCGQSSGSALVTVNAGVAPFAYIWSNSATTQDLQNIPSGNYTLTVTGTNGCSATSAFVVPDSTVIPLLTGTTQPNTTCIGPNGSVNLVVSPTTLPYVYTWSNAETTQSIANLTAGTYTVTVNGGGACTATASFVVANNTNSATLTGTPLNLLCFGDSNGAIDLVVNGGTAPFAYNWSPGSVGAIQDPANLTAGTYAVTVTDAVGCTTTASFIVTQPSASVQISCNQISSVSQPGFTDGSAQIKISGGTAPYQVIWSPGSTQNNVAAGNFELDNLGAGSYNVTVTDANGCSTTCNFSIGVATCTTIVGTMSGALIAHCGTDCITATYNDLNQFLDPNDVLQFILHTGSGNAIVGEIARNTQPTFCFNAAQMTFGTTYYISAVVGNNNGSGSVVLTHFCTEVAPGTPIVFYEKPVVTVATPASITCATLQVPVTASVNVPNSTFQWTTTGGTIVGSTTQATIQASKEGIYTVIAKTPNGCADTSSTIVSDIRNNPIATILASPDDVLDCTISEIILAGSVKNSDNPSLIWIGADGTTYPGGTVLPISNPGTYQFVILDTLTYCTDTATIVISADQSYPLLFINPPGVLTCTAGSVTLTGGSPLPGIQLAWATVNGQDTTIVGSGTTLTVTQPGTYYIIGSDPINNCSNALSATVIADQSYPVASAGAPFNIDCYGQTATLNGSGGPGGPLAYKWTTSDGHIVTGATSPSPTINEPGTYNLTVTNTANGCSDTDVVTIAPKEPKAIAVVDNPDCFGQKGTIIIDTVLGGKPPLRYSINDGQTYTLNNIFGNLNPGDYTVFVTDANGCTTSVNATVVQPVQLQLTVEPQVTLQLGESYLATAQVNVPLTEIAHVTWTPPTWLSCDTCLTTRIDTPFTSQLYRILVVTKAGCKDDASLLLRVNDQVNIYVPNVFDPSSSVGNDGFTIYADVRGVRKIKSFQIYSRWGEQVFERTNFPPNDPTLGWDGRYKNQDMNPAVFVWYAVVELIDGEELLLKGDVTVVR